MKQNEAKKRQKNYTDSKTIVKKKPFQQVELIPKNNLNFAFLNELVKGLDNVEEKFA